MTRKKVASRADVELHKNSETESEVMLLVKSADGRPLTGNQILEAVAEAILLYWDHIPIESRDELEFDA